MALYKLTKSGIQPIKQTAFAQEKIRERTDLQRLLRDKIEIVSKETLVIAEEYGEFEGSRSRIDLLGVDKTARLVVIELKRSEDGGHMDLQAIRYASMVSVMTFDNAVDAFEQYLTRNGKDLDARESLLSFLNWEEPDDEAFAQEVRIVLVSADFSNELGSSVTWLNEQGLDITCVRFSPYKLDEDLILDVAQIIPPPETSDYEVKIKGKRQRERQARSEKRDYSRFDMEVDGTSHSGLPKRWMVFHYISALIKKGITPEAIMATIPWRGKSMFETFAGTLNGEEFIKAMENKWPSEGVPRYKRYFRQDEELFHIDGKTVALTNQWGDRTLEAIDTLREAFASVTVSYKVAGKAED